MSSMVVQSKLGQELLQSAVTFAHLREQIEGHSLYRRHSAGEMIYGQEGYAELEQLISSSDDVVEKLRKMNIGVQPPMTKDGLKWLKRSYEQSQLPTADQTSPVVFSSTGARNVFVDDKELVFENIVCYDAAGAETERYPSLRVMRNAYHGADGKMLFFKPYDAIVHAESQGDFNPSSQLTMALIIAAYRGRQNFDINAFLEQYKDKGNGSGYHVLNTVTRWQGEQARLIHYPLISDFPQGNHRTVQINQARQRRAVDFTVDNTFADKLISTVPAQSEFKRFLSTWYGLPDLGIVVEIGNHFSEPAKAWVLSNPTSANYTSGAWLGCYGGRFDCNSYSYLSSAGAFRGVR